VSDFVLDESVYIRALAAERTRSNDDERAAFLVHCLQVHHRWIMSADILTAYHRQFGLRVTTKDAVSHELMVSLKLVLADAAKYVVLHNPPRISGAYDHDDDHVVSAAAAGSNGTILITLDERLRASLSVNGIPAAHGFRVLDVDEAWREMCR
jgi:hypothetical protein